MSCESASRSSYQSEGSQLANRRRSDSRGLSPLAVSKCSPSHVFVVTTDPMFRAKARNAQHVWSESRLSEERTPTELTPEVTSLFQGTWHNMDQGTQAIRQRPEPPEMPRKHAHETGVSLNETARSQGIGQHTFHQAIRNRVAP